MLRLQRLEARFRFRRCVSARARVEFWWAIRGVVPRHPEHGATLGVMHSTYFGLTRSLGDGNQTGFELDLSSRSSKYTGDAGFALRERWRGEQEFAPHPAVQVRLH